MKKKSSSKIKITPKKAAAIAVVLIALIALIFAVRGRPKHRDVLSVSPSSVYESAPVETEPLQKTEASSESFEAHFIDVGQGDSSLIICGGHSMLIDGGMSSCSRLMYAYLQAQGIDHLDYIVCTHPHEDHV